MKRLSVPLALLVGLTLAACGGGSPAPTSSSTTTPSESAGPTESASPTADPPGPLAGFELSGSALIAVDADGEEIESHPFSDLRGLIDALTAFLGAPSEGPAADGCGVNVAVWPSEDVADVVVAYEPPGDLLAVSVRSATVGIQPSAGPLFGENAAAFAGSLPAGHSEPGYAYVYDAVTTLDDGTAVGGVAFLDLSGNVESLASPSPPYGSGYC